MRIAITLLVLFLTSPPFYCVQEQNTEKFGIGFGNQFYDNCAATETLRYGGTGVQNVEAMFCLGYAEGLIHGIMAADIMRGVGLTFCAPLEVTNLQAVRVIRKYIADHPERAHEVTSILAVEALRKAFPCKG
jgi:hypothetical protein